jgi:mannosyltransferase
VPEAATPPPSRRYDTLGVGAAMLLLLGLSLHGLVRHSLWLDEAYAVAVARQDLSAIAPSLADESGPPLYYWILHLWIALFGDGERAVRLLSVVFGVLLVPATALLARRIAGRRAGASAAFLIASTPIVVQFSQEARMYTLLPLLAVLAAERLLAYMQEGRRGALVAHALLLAAIGYVHNWGILLIPGAALAAVALGPRARLRGYALGALAALLLYAPWARVLLSQASAQSFRFIGMVQPIRSWELPFRSLVVFASGVGTTGAEARSLLPSPGGLLAACGWGALLAAPLLDSRRRHVALALLLMSAAPLAAATAYSALVRPIYLLGRYEILVLPILVALVAGAATDLLRGGRLAGVITIWVLGLSALSFSYTSRVQRRFPERDMALRLAPELRDGDRVVFTGLYRAAMEYYLRRSGARFEAASFPPDVADHLGWFYDGLYSTDDPALTAAARADCPEEGRRTWIAASGTRTCRLLLEQLGRCARLTSPFQTIGPPSSYLLLAVPKDGG